MFNNIHAIKFDNSQPLKSSSELIQSESVSIFTDNSVQEKELTKAEKKALKEAQKQERNRIKNEPDGVIQGGKQGSTAGDCWLLAQMNSMATTSWGKEIFKNAITKNENGNYVVHFKGVGEDVEVSSEEFKRAKRSTYYSDGDADPLLFEVAVEKYFKSKNINDGSIYGNDLAGEDSLQYLLTGTKGRQTSKRESYEPILKAMGSNPENAGIAATYVFYDHSQGAGGTSHAISVQKVILDDKGEVKEVELLDSYKPKSPYRVSYKRFTNELQAFGFVATPSAFRTSGHESE